MARRATFTRATTADALALAADMRDLDRAEVALWTGMTPVEAAVRSVELSDVAFAARVNGKLHCIFGASIETLVDANAVGWMLCTNEPDRRPVDFLANCRAAFRLISDCFPNVETLTNYVYADNGQAVRWLDWAGAWFSVEPAQSGVMGGTFRRFAINLKDAERKG